MSDWDSGFDAGREGALEEKEELRQELEAENARLREVEKAARSVCGWCDNDTEWRGRMDIFETLIEELEKVLKETND